MGADLLDAITAWPVLIAALVVFGFAPGAVLRLIVLAFPREDPRRRELLAELHAVPRFDRPFWVVEQLEVALCEGIWGRIVWAATGRIIDRWHLDSGVDRSRMYPDTFWIPDEEEKAALEAGVTVRLMFELKDGWCERMWVKVTDVSAQHVRGTLVNQPAGIPRLNRGDEIKFERDHIIDINWAHGTDRPT